MVPGGACVSGDDIAHVRSQSTLVTIFTKESWDSSFSPSDNNVNGREGEKLGDEEEETSSSSLEEGPAWSSVLRLL